MVPKPHNSTSFSLGRRRGGAQRDDFYKIQMSVRLPKDPKRIVRPNISINKSVSVGTRIKLRSPVISHENPSNKRISIWIGNV